MINNDSIVTAYDEHLTLVEWLQKVEKLITENALESVQVNNVSASTYTLTLTFADGSSITSNTFDLATITQALTLIGAKADTALNNSVANASEITKIKNGVTPLFENITDSHGNKRFVEGNITMGNIEGITQTYGKWSLSGTHLMLAFVFTADAGTALPTSSEIARVTLPQFILNKINPLDQGGYIDGKTFYMRGKTNWWQITYSLNIALNKGQNYISFSTTSVIPTITTDCVVRIQFDLLIDNE
jgi:hypothetical protein